MNEWRPATGDDILRPRRLRRILEPVHERHFTYAVYDRWLARLASSGAAILPLAELATAQRDRATVALRHDVDDRIESALVLARLERAHDIRATYFVLHTAGYWGRPDLPERLLELQSLGHEVGWHNDLVTLQVVYGVDARRYLADELERLRGAGVRIRGTSSHGSYWAHALGYRNGDFFAELPHRHTPAVEVRVDGELRRVPTGTLAEFGFDYEAYFLDEDVYVSDSTFDGRGRRWHPGRFDPRSLEPGQRAIVLVHPCHWDRSAAAKYARLLARGVRLALGQTDHTRRRTSSWTPAL